MERQATYNYESRSVVNASRTVTTSRRAVHSVGMSFVSNNVVEISDDLVSTSALKTDRKTVLMASRKSASGMSENTDTDSYLTADDSISASETSSDDNSDSLVDTLHEVQFNSIGFDETRRGSHDANGEVVLRKYVKKHDGSDSQEVFQDPILDDLAVSTFSESGSGTVGREPEPRRRSYQFAIDDSGNIIPENGSNGESTSDSDGENEECEYVLFDDLDPVEFNHLNVRDQPVRLEKYCSLDSIGDCVHDLDPAEFNHPRLSTERHESVVRGSGESKLIVQCTQLNRSPHPARQTDHRERIVSVPARRAFIDLSSSTIPFSQIANQDPFASNVLPNLADDETVAESAALDLVSDERTSGWTNLPVVEATVSETMEIIRATLVECISSYSRVSTSSVLVETEEIQPRVFNDSFLLPEPDYSTGSSEDNDGFEDNDRDVTEVLKCDRSVTPEPDYDVESPIADSSSLSGGGHMQSPMFRLEQDDDDSDESVEDESANQTRLRRKGSFFKKKTKKPTRTKSLSVPTVPEMEFEESASKNSASGLEEADSNDLAHSAFESDPETRTPAQTHIYGPGFDAVPVVMTRREREKYLQEGRPSPNASMDADQFAYSSPLYDQSKSAGTDLKDLAIKTRRREQRSRKKLKSAAHVDRQFPVYQTVAITLRKDAKGFGMTLSGSSPVFVQSVVENGAAAKEGVQEGDRITKVNGTLVTDMEHSKVTELIKSAGLFVQLHLLRSQPSQPVHDNVVPSGALLPTGLELSGSGLWLSKPTGISRNPALNRSLSPDSCMLTPTLNESDMIIAADSDDDNYEEDVRNYAVVEQPIRGDFSDIESLKFKPAHMSVFLCYVLSTQCSPASVLFSLVIDGYNAANSIKELTRWAQELFATFLADAAPLKLDADRGLIESIERKLVHGKVDTHELQVLFRPLYNYVTNDADVLLMGFRQKQAIGLGSIYGEQYLKPNMDRNDAMKVVESQLCPLVHQHWNETSDYGLAVAVALVTYIKQTIVSLKATYQLEPKTAMLLEACPTFNTKDKKASWLKPVKKSLSIQCHQFMQLNGFASHHCILCAREIWNAFNTGFQCTGCQNYIHKFCMANIHLPCTAATRGSRSARDKNDRRRLTSIIDNFLPSRTATISQPGDIKSDQRALDDSGLYLGDSVSSSHGIGHSDSFLSDTRSSVSGATSLTRSTTSGSIRHMSKPFDPDMYVESVLPSLDDVIPKEEFQKLKKEEKKRQEVINELFHTEKKHVSLLKIMFTIFYQPMYAENWIGKGYAQEVFPSIEQLIDVHVALSNDFKKRRMQSAVVLNVGDILIDRLSGENGEQFIRVCSDFCRDQKYMLESLRTKMRKESRFAAFLQDAAADPLCQRQELKDLLIIEMQRLTRYPLLIERIMKYTAQNSEEYSQLKQALSLAENLTHQVDNAVKERENLRKAVDFEKRLDKRPNDVATDKVLAAFKNLRRHQLLHDGMLSWRLGAGKQVEVHAALFEHVIALMQPQEDKLLLRSQNVTLVAGKEKVPHGPVISLDRLLVREFAADKRAFFLITTSKDTATRYELVAESSEKKSTWLKCISNAITEYGRKKVNRSQDFADTSLEISGNVEQDRIEPPGVVNVMEVSSNVEVVHLENASAPCERTDSDQSIAVTAAETVAVVEAEESSRHSKYEELHKTVTSLHQLLSEKRSLVAEPHNPRELEDKSEPADTGDDIGQASIFEVNKLLETIENALKYYDNATDAADSDDQEQLVAMPADELIAMSQQLHKLLVQLTERAQSADEENCKLEGELRAARDQLSHLVGQVATDDSAAAAVTDAETSVPSNFMTAADQDDQIDDTDLYTSIATK